MSHSPTPWLWKPGVTGDAEGELAKLLDANGELVCDFGRNDQYYNTCGTEPSNANRDFILRASQAFDVMMRRGWAPVKGIGPSWSWFLIEQELSDHVASGALTTGRADPFTCLVEADKWYRENVEKMP